MKRNFIFICLVIFCLSGCIQAVCRHKVLEGVAIATELRLKYRIVVYDLNNPIIYSHHAQTQVYKDGKWMWMNESFGYYTFSDQPEQPIKSKMYIYSLPEYLSYLEKARL